MSALAGRCEIARMRTFLDRASRSRFETGLALLVAIVTSIAVTGCLNLFVTTVAVKVDRPKSGTTEVTSPLKAHLMDGRTVVFKGGARIDSREITGVGMAYALLATAGEGSGTPVSRVPLDSVVGVEAFQTHTLGLPSFVVSVAATAVTVVAVGVAAVAIFGSCPTVYADTGTGPVLQAEGFSYSIAPLLEQSDLDPLRVKPDADGVIRLELRNEALETHYINAIELVAVRHAADARALPDQDDHPLVASNIVPLASARDRAGRDVRSELAAEDGVLFATASRTLNAAKAGDLDDWIDVDASDLPPGDSVAVVLRLRNSLLNTVLLYDGILGGRDAVNWLDTGLEHISSAIDLGRWYLHTLGMHVAVDGKDQARLSDVGPIAFRDVAIVLPRSKHNARSVHARLRFVADDWRIDYAAIAGTIERPARTRVPVQRVMVRATSERAAFSDTAAVSALREPDGRYLVTSPGQRMTLEFNAPRDVAHADTVTTYMISWQGWYREWIRGSWLAAPKRLSAWSPSDASVAEALRSWRANQAEMERKFYSQRVPVQ
jgi:hypothetical protein